MANYDIGVIGLGYVGLTLGAVLAETGNQVIGVEKRSEVVDQTNAGMPHSPSQESANMVRVEVESLMHAAERDVITALDRRAAAAGLRTASLDEVLCIAEF